MAAQSTFSLFPLNALGGTLPSIKNKF